MTLHARSLGLEMLTDRQARVMRAVVAAFVAEAAPVGSKTVSELLAIPLSSASIRNTMAELSDLGLIEKPHSSSGRIPTEDGMRLFVDHLLTPQPVASEQQRRLRNRFGATDVDGAMNLASHILSESTRQLGFVVAPRIDRVRLRHISLVRLSSDRLLVIFVTSSGRSVTRMIHDSESGDQRALDQIALLINERIGDCTLSQLRELLRAEAESLRSHAGSLLARAVDLGRRALDHAEVETGSVDLLVATRLALLDQPEFSDPTRLRELFTAIEANEKLQLLMGKLLDAGEVNVTLGDELGAQGLSHCALVTAPYGRAAGLTKRPGTDEQPGKALGVLGVIGPSRMDYGRIIPLVRYCSQLVTEKFNEIVVSDILNHEQGSNP